MNIRHITNIGKGIVYLHIFGFNTKDYKLPNGITLEFGDDDPAAKQKVLKQKKGTIEITYASYVINQGVSNSMF